MILAFLLAGCGYRVHLESLPEGASVRLPDGDVVTTPESVDLRWAPFQHQVVVVSAPGYRSAEVDLRRHEITLMHMIGDVLFRPGGLGKKDRGHVTLVLVPEHGPAGTWDPRSEGLE